MPAPAIPAITEALYIAERGRAAQPDPFNVTYRTSTLHKSAEQIRNRIYRLSCRKTKRLIGPV